MRALILSFLLATSALAQTPQATTATYDNWTLGCQTQGEAQSCQIVTRLNVKGGDGQLRPLLAMALLTTDAGRALRIELPAGVDLRAAARLDASGVEGQDPLAVFGFLTCGPGICLAETQATEELIDLMVKAEAMDISFALFDGGKVVRVPVSLIGFGAAVAGLK